MKQLKQSDLDQLARYIDDELNAIERASFERRLGENELLQEKYLAMAETHAMLKSQPLQSPSKNFTERVMQNLDLYTPPTVTFSVKNGIFLLAGVLVAGVLALYLVSHGTFDGQVSVFNPAKYTLTQKLIDTRLPSVSFDGKTIVNVIVLINLVIAWVVLDRTILRPLFRRRMGVN